jgi:hypothetical protein
MDWIRFLEENNIHYVTRSQNTKRGEISIQCPLCGDEDPSTHLGINLQTEKWGCLRNQAHRGKTARTLIRALLGCSRQQMAFIYRQYTRADPDSLEGVLAVLEADQNGSIHHAEDVVKQAKHQKIGPQFQDFTEIKVRGVTKRFFNYLVERGYENPLDITKHYDLRCALTGAYKDRIIIPVRLNDELLGWTSRAIGEPVNAPRYLASSEDVKITVFNYDELKEGGNRLFIVEGPFDAIKLDNYGCGIVRDNRFRATCTFGTSFTLSQIALLRALVKKYEETYILFDQGADEPADNLAQWLGAKRAYLPPNIKDPGDLADRHLRELSHSSFRGCFGHWKLGFTFE